MADRIHAIGTVLVALLTAACAAGCVKAIEGRPVPPSTAAVDRSLIFDYFQRSNATAVDGASAQKQFLERTQHPDVKIECDLGDLTVLLDPSFSTLRPDRGWRPEGADEAPRGRIYVIAVMVTVQRDGATLGAQIGSMHLAVLDGMAYGFAPCPA